MSAPAAGADGSRRVELTLTLGAGLCCALAIVLAQDLRLGFQVALVAGFLGVAGLVVIPNRRLALVLVWILVHPLSIEKVFVLGEGLLPDFFGPTLVVSASDLALVLLTILLVLEQVFTADRSSLRWPAAATPWAALLSWTTVVAFWRSPNLAGFLSVGQGLKMLLFIIVLSSAVRTRRELLLVLAAMAASVAVQDVLVNLAHYTHQVFTFSGKLSVDLMGFSGGGDQTYARATGTVGHVNQTASFLTFFTLPLFGLLAVKNRWARGAVRLVFLMTVLAVIYTYSRTAWVSLALALGVLLTLAFRKRLLDRRSWIAAFPVAMVLLVLAAAYGGSILDRLVSGDEGATDSRKRSMLLAMDLTRPNPIGGVGPGNFAAAALDRYPPERLVTKWVEAGEDVSWMAGEYGRIEVSEVRLADGTRKAFPLPVHNKFLLILTEQGLVGLALFLWFQWRIFCHARRALHACDRIIVWTGLGVMAAFWATQSYMNLDLFADGKTMEILFIVPVMAVIVDHLGTRDEDCGHA